MPVPVVAPLITGVVRVFAASVCASFMPTIAEAGAVNPPCSCAFRFVTWVVLAMENGAVPVDTVEVI